jgi:putative ABC transport system substrate-binding protein
MRRREFIMLASGAAAAWPLAARAQQTVMPVIGFLQEGSAIPHLLAPFREGLAEAGYVEGKNLAIEYRYSKDRPKLLPEAAGDLVRLNVNVIFAAAPFAIAAASNATNSIPIVAIDLESDPVAKGYVKSLARPGGNVTGMFLDIPELSGKQLGLLEEIVPRLSRIAIIGIPGLNEAQFAATETAVRALALKAEIIEVRSPDDFEGALDAAKTRHVEAGILLSSPSFSSLQSKSASLRLPNSSPSSPCSPNFQKSAVYWLMGRT